MLTKLEIAAIYAGVNVLTLLVLAVRVVLVRRSYRVALGDGANIEIQRRVRAHGNASEYIPAGIAGLLFLALLNPTPVWLVHLVGGALTIGRIAHGIGLSGHEGPSVGRMVGTVLTWTAFLALALGLIWSGGAPLL